MTATPPSGSWVNGHVELVVPLGVSPDASMAQKMEAVEALVEEITQRLPAHLTDGVAARWEVVDAEGNPIK